MCNLGKILRFLSSLYYYGIYVHPPPTPHPTTSPLCTLDLFSCSSKVIPINSPFDSASISRVLRNFIMLGYETLGFPLNLSSYFFLPPPSPEWIG